MASTMWQSLRKGSAALFSIRSYTTAAAPVITEAAVPKLETHVPNNELVSQLVNTIMRDGKKARAQRLVSDSMKWLEKKNSVADPYGMLSEAIESASPLLKLTTTKKGSKAIHVPTPLRLRQRRRRAIVWMLESAKKRPEATFEQRFAAEVFDVIQGTSPALQKKAQIHKQALANRANAQVSYNTQSR
ncbi:ribosomal protein S7 domain-containing protein [Zychaea mexicana]|uniref:ribosomal protein S7 domain-containing protein n=1 Tax=Zychaea mexicana TaxID=64656 RepID=UPI0022FDEDDC|nr:ribosomal protein S7 domain-containing protein [Zychaea mexicana]KAI9491314.1 ribosomal protein S7 domain-containing protein [Zychaea mexicana]